MLCKYYWIVLYTVQSVHVTAFCLGGPFFPGHGVQWQAGQRSMPICAVCLRQHKKETYIQLTN